MTRIMVLENIQDTNTTQVMGLVATQAHSAETQAMLLALNPTCTSIPAWERGITTLGQGKARKHRKLNSKGGTHLHRSTLLPTKLTSQTPQARQSMQRASLKTILFIHQSPSWSSLHSVLARLSTFWSMLMDSSQMLFTRSECTNMVNFKQLPQSVTTLDESLDLLRNETSVEYSTHSRTQSEEGSQINSPIRMATWVTYLSRTCFWTSAVKTRSLEKV